MCVGKQVTVSRSCVQAALQQPCLKNDGAWVRFNAWPATTSLDLGGVNALHLLKQSFWKNAFDWAGWSCQPAGAADAWALGGVAGVGGWFRGAGNITHWFHIPFSQQDFPTDWCCPEKLEKAICAIEMVAQQALLLARAKVESRSTLVHVVLRQMSDNMGVVGSLGKGLCSKPPLSCALMYLCLSSLEIGCRVQASHVAGDRNQDADQLSRRNCPGFKFEDGHFAAFPPSTRVALSVSEVMAPWMAFRSGVVPKCTGCG